MGDLKIVTLGARLLGYCVTLIQLSDKTDNNDLDSHSPTKKQLKTDTIFQKV